MAATSSAWYFDGKRAQGRAVRVTFDGLGRFCIEGLETPHAFPLEVLEIPSRLGGTPRAIRLPDGALCEVADNDLVDAALARAGRGGGSRLLALLEGSYWAALGALLATGLVVWWGMVAGIPMLAQRVAQHLPVGMERALGEQAIAEMERQGWLLSTDLSREEQEALTAAFRRVTARVEGGGDFQLLFRKSKTLGANAFAIPGGTVVLTDDLARLYETMAEAETIFAHEAGHLSGRHTLRQILQSSASTLLIMAVTGDLSSLTALTTAVPALFLEARFSREFEEEADQAAMAYMREKGLPSEAFTAILARLEETHGGSMERSTQYLDSHPATRERIDAFRQLDQPAQ